MTNSNERGGAKRSDAPVQPVPAHPQPVPTGEEARAKARNARLGRDLRGGPREQQGRVGQQTHK